MRWQVAASIAITPLLLITGCAVPTPLAPLRPAARSAPAVTHAQQPDSPHPWTQPSLHPSGPAVNPPMMTVQVVAPVSCSAARQWQPLTITAGQTTAATIPATTTTITGTCRLARGAGVLTFDVPAGDLTGTDGAASLTLRPGDQPSAAVDVRRARASTVVRLEYRPCGRHRYALSRVAYSARHSSSRST